MIAVVEISCQAANPSMPLWPFRSFVGSPSSLRIRNVPRKIGTWNITAVQVVVAYPDGSIKTADCVLTNGIWVGTVDGCPISGTSDQGYAVYASGVDEHGNAVTGYILGKGDVEILETDGTITPGETKTYVHLLSAQAEVPADGDLWPDGDGGWWIWQDGEAKEIGTNIGDLDDRYLTLNGSTQVVTQHPVFDSGMLLYGETVVYGGSTTNFYPGSTLSIYPMNTMSETPAAKFVLHGAELSGKNSGIVVVSSDISSDIDSIRYKADLTALDMYATKIYVNDLVGDIEAILSAM